MSVKIAKWGTYCDRCGHLYGEYWNTEEEARAYDEEGDGICAECASGGGEVARA